MRYAELLGEIIEALTHPKAIKHIDYASAAPGKNGLPKDLSGSTTT